ncbi:MAG: hypothetical protein CME62_11285 [Halobacteriovoraceae bacterium]|nr:hypothetical protein [Halobacteriovoraceae bacterium]|tara:strand:- start:12894 stop:13160 length:267 start_codon:yes stop_codon:yes gene_type:complete
MSHSITQELVEYEISVSKDKSSFVYFTLESNENICFYSTKDFEKGSLTRELLIRCTPELKPELDSILKHLQKKFPITFLSQKIIKDSL